MPAIHSSYERNSISSRRIYDIVRDLQEVIFPSEVVHRHRIDILVEDEGYADGKILRCDSASQVDRDYARNAP